MLCLGVLIGRFFGQNLPANALGVVDLAAAAGLALVVALAYRRFARRTLAERRRLRALRAHVPDEALAPSDERA